jgi:integrase
MPKLTDRSVKSASTLTREQFLSDGEGLYLRVRPKDAPKVWFFRYTLDGKTKKIQIGTYPAMTLLQARETKADLLKLTKQGKDPAAIRAEDAAKLEAEKIHLSSRLTVNDLFDRWLATDLIRRKDKGAEVARMFKKDVLPTLGSLYVEDVRKGHITGITDALLKRDVPRMAKVVFSQVRQMFRFAVDREIIEFDPAASIRKSKIGGKDVERDRVLSEEEVKAVYRQIPNAGVLDTTQLAVWICLATCCRIGELVSALVDDVDLEARTWRIPADNSKNGKPHTIQLSDFAITQFKSLIESADRKQQQWHEKKEKQRELLKGLKGEASVIEANETTTPEKRYLFPNDDYSDHISTKTITKQLGDRQRAGKLPLKRRAKSSYAEALVLKGGKWTPHDLRRTGATMMVMLGVLPEVAERCLNHTEQNKVKRTYQHHTYEREMGQAWRLLGERIELLTTKAGSNVKTIEKSAA